MGIVINKLAVEAIGNGPDPARACGISRSHVLDESVHIPNPAQVGALDHKAVKLQAIYFLVKKCSRNLLKALAYKQR